MKQHLFFAAAGLLALSFPAIGQGKSGHDLREVVTKKDGTEVRGRILRRTADEVVVVQGKNGRGSKVRVRQKDIAKVDALRDRMHVFFQKRKEAGRDADKLWQVTKWALDNKLPKLARVLAMEVVLLDDRQEDAHKLLGHRKRGKRWLWKRKSSFLSRKKYEAYISKWGHPLILDLEHYVLRTNAPLQKAVAMAFDLERLYLHWFDLFAKDWDLKEITGGDERVRIQVYRQEKGFPALTSNELPYCLPDATNDVSRTFLTGKNGNGEPIKLLSTATQHLVYRTLFGARLNTDDPRQHISAWLEVGLGEYLESMFQGELGRREPSEPVLTDDVLARAWRRDLKNFIHLNYAQFLEVSRRVPRHWATAQAFVHFLLDAKYSDRERSLSYIYQVFAKQAGDSSSAFDKLMGRRIEKVERTFRVWLDRQRKAARPGR